MNEIVRTISTLFFIIGIVILFVSSYSRDSNIKWILTGCAFLLVGCFFSPSFGLIT